jgi:pimeloyl-ACP methyl ester carboxylesterase
MGGALAINVAATDTMDGLVLMAPYWKMSGPFWGLLPIFRRFFPVVYPYRLLKRNYSNPEVRKGMSKFMPKVDFDSTFVQAGIRDLPVPVSILEEIRQLGLQTWRLAPQVKTTTLVLQGSQDRIVKPHLTRQLVDRIQASKRYSEVNTGHDIPDPNKPAWSHVVREILSFSEKLIDPSG